MKTVKFFNRVFSVILCLSVLFRSSVLAFASTEQTIFSDLLDTQYSNWTDLPDDFKALGEAYANFFKFDGLNSFIDDAGQIALSWFKVLKDGTPVLSPVGGIFYTLDSAGNLLVEDRHSSTHGRHRADIGDIVIPSETFKESIDKQNNWYTPKNTSNKISYRNEEYYSTANGREFAQLTLYNPRFGFCNKYFSSNTVYLLPFYTNGENIYFSRYQLQFKLDLTTKDDGTRATDFDLMFYDMLSADPMSEPVSTQKITSLADACYFTIAGHFHDNVYLERHDTLTEYVNHSPSSYGIYKVKFPDNARQYINSKDYTDLLTVGSLPGNHFIQKHSEHDKDCPYGELDDIGYYCSTVPISIVYPFDTSRIPDNYVITINGDTVYDYSITNPETGETDTINNYVTNSYTFTGSGNGGGGEAGGNITVGGKIDVGGTVDVKVDVNVNGGSAGNDISNDAEFEGNLNEYIRYIPEVSEGFTKYLKNFFGWLPPPVFGILMLGLIVSVWCRWRGR